MWVEDLNGLALDNFHLLQQLFCFISTTVNNIFRWIMLQWLWGIKCIPSGATVLVIITKRLSQWKWMSCNQVLQPYTSLYCNKSTLICHLHLVNYQWRVLKAPNPSSSQYNEIPYQRYGHTAVADNHLVCSLRFSFIFGHI